MHAAPGASILDMLLGSHLGGADAQAGNRFKLEGLTWAGRQPDVLEFGIRNLDAESLLLTAGPHALEIARLSVRQVSGQLLTGGAQPRLGALHAADVELSGLKLRGPVTLSDQDLADLVTPEDPTAGGASAWSLAPLATAEGTMRAEILDAHLLFDADVTVPIRQGQVDFNMATVEHVGPDSRMGVSRLGFYVDAPNGRSYLYQFSAAPVAGVKYERRGALLGAFVADRGNVRLQEFGEGLLRQGRAAHGPGITDQARLLFDRTAVSGHVQLGDGRLAGVGVQAEMAGRAEGRNVVRLHSQAVGRGLTVEVASLLVRHALWASSATQWRADEITGALTLRLAAEKGQLRFEFELQKMKLAGLRLQAQRDAGA